MPRRKNEIIFAATIYRPGSRYMPLGSEEVSEIEPRVRSALTEDLPRDMDSIFDVRIDVQIKGTRSGSFAVFFGVVVAGVSALSRYKNLFDSAVLIRDQAHRVIIAALQKLDKSGEYNVEVEAVDPNLDSLRQRYRWWRHPDQLSVLSESCGDDSGARHRRDGFFWFLLALCILEGVTIGLLVYKAVLKTYF